MDAKCSRLQDGQLPEELHRRTASYLDRDPAGAQRVRERTGAVADQLGLLRRFRKMHGEEQPLVARQLGDGAVQRRAHGVQGMRGNPDA